MVNEKLEEQLTIEYISKVSTCIKSYVNDYVELPWNKWNEKNLFYIIPYRFSPLAIHRRVDREKEYVSQNAFRLSSRYDSHTSYYLVSHKCLLLLLSRFSRVRLCATPEMAAHQAPPSLGFSKQEHWSGLPFPSPMHESEKGKWSRSVVSDP